MCQYGRGGWLGGGRENGGWVFGEICCFPVSVTDSDIHRI